MTSEQACREQLARLINTMPFIAPAAVTLTMKKRHGARSVDDIAASENFKHFRNRLEHSLLGSAAKRYGRHLLMIVVLETSADNRLHYHCIIDRPYHCTFHRFITVVREEWARTDFGYRQVDIQDEPDEGWTSYLLKRRQKRSLLDSIDWANCQLFAE